MSVLRCLLVLGTLSIFAQTPLPRARVIWSDETTDDSGYVSPDGRWLTYMNYAASEMYARNLLTGENRRLTQKDASNPTHRPYAGLISPDGTQVVYSFAATDRAELRLSAWDSGTARVLQSVAAVRFTPYAWTHDGKRILCSRGGLLNDSSEIGFWDLEGSRFNAVAKLTPLVYASLSPDDSQIAASALDPKDATRRRIVLIDARSGAMAAPFPDHDAEDWAPVWAQKGRALVFVSNRGGGPRLWRVSIEGRAVKGTPAPIANLPDGFDTILGVTPDDVVYAGAEDIDGDRVFVGAIDWAEGRIAGVSEVQTPPFTGARRASFSPDGKQLAYLRKGRGAYVRPGWQIPIVRNLDTGIERVYRTALTLRDEPVWSRNGRSLLFAANPEGNLGEGNAGIWTFRAVDLADGSWRTVGAASGPGQVRIASATDSSITYLLNDFTKGGALMTLDLRSGASRLLRQFNTTLSEAAVSPDGSRIAVAFLRPQDASVQIINLANNTLQNVSSIRPNARPQLVWFPDGQSLVIGGRIGPQDGLWRLSPSGEQLRRVQLDVPNVSEVRITEDAKKVAFTQRARKPVEVVAVNLAGN